MFRGKKVAEKPSIMVKCIENGEKSLKKNIFDQFPSVSSPVSPLKCYFFIFSTRFVIKASQYYNS